MIGFRHRSVLLFLIPLVFATVTSAAGLVFPAKSGPGAKKHVVFITGEWAFRSEESFPMMAKIFNSHHGFKTTVLFAINPDGDYVHPNYNKSIPGLETLKTADLLIIQTRWRDLPDEQLQHIAAYVNAGKPIIGTRCASHAFNTFKRKSMVGGIDWYNFGHLVFGEGWKKHFDKNKKNGGKSTIAAEHKSHPIVQGVDPIFTISETMGCYTALKLNPTVLMKIQLVDGHTQEAKPVEGKDPQAAVWLKEYKAPQGAKAGQALYISMGHAQAYLNEGMRRLMVNGAYHLTGLKVPAKANVDFVDPWEPSREATNRRGDHYSKLNYKPADYGYGKSAYSGPRPKRKK